AVSQPQPSAAIDQRLHRRVTIALQIALLFGIGLELWNGQWLNVATTSAVLALTLLPMFLGRRFNVFIPPELEALALLFVFSALFLGEVRGYYARYWWWDAVLHTASGFLLGIVGFLLVHVLNEKEDLELHMKPGFVALFSFMFAVGLGALWEIFEFAMDSVFGLNMQRSGLVDTMWDLIVDAAGALLIAVLGYGYLSRARNVSFLERWIARFIHANRRFFEGSA
ncbi:MAG TPA: hypothetical protein VLD59_00675, partial [Steroidobacteraceae bacterium]|nr:hypothetical protein [Steroidobacteraceae bacterium]